MVANEKGFRHLNKLMAEQVVSKKALDAFIALRTSEGYCVRLLGTTHKVVHTSTRINRGHPEQNSLVVVSEITGKPIEAKEHRRCWEQLYAELVTDLQEH